jgi:beta-lactamase superfamily II metal-dependent hydrolase
LESFKVDNVFWTGETATTQTFTDWKKAMDASGAKETIVKRGDVINEGGLTLNVLDPTKTTDSDVDLDCIVTSLQFGSQSFLFMGDDGQPAEDNLISSGLLQHFDVLKIGHHGSDTASSQEFVDIVKPEYAIYECGLNDSYGFPKADIIARWQTSGAAIYGTDINGTVTYESNGVTATITSAKSP